MDVGRRGRPYALHLELVAHLRFVDLHFGVTPAVLVTRARTSFSPVKDASRVARASLATTGTAAISTTARTSAASRVSLLIDLSTSSGWGSSPHHTYSNFYAPVDGMDQPSLRTSQNPYSTHLGE